MAGFSAQWGSSLALLGMVPVEVACAEVSRHQHFQSLDARRANVNVRLDGGRLVDTVARGLYLQWPHLAGVHGWWWRPPMVKRPALGKAVAAGSEGDGVVVARRVAIGTSRPGFQVHRAVGIEDVVGSLFAAQLRVGLKATSGDPAGGWGCRWSHRRKPGAAKSTAVRRPGRRWRKKSSEGQ